MAQTYDCDRCGKKITGQRHAINYEYYQPSGIPFVWGLDYCGACWKIIAEAIGWDIKNQTAK